jgi:glycosyltransferase involved in cell wall biosynthesis
MSDSTTVSVIIPCFNVAKYVRDAIRSVRNQTYRDVEILCVDDGSTDDTPLLLREEAAADPRVRIVTRSNGGLPAARNTGLKHAQGGFICFLDADDVFLPDKIERQVRFLAEHPDIDLVYSDYYEGDSELNLVGLRAPRIAASDMTEALAEKNWFTPQVPLLRRRMVEAAGEFDPSLRASEDWDYWIRCSRAGKFGYLPGPVAIYRLHANQMHHDSTRMFTSGKRVLRKHYRGNHALYHRALALFYERNARYSWNGARRLQTALYLALSACHGGAARIASRCGSLRGSLTADAGARRLESL